MRLVIGDDVRVAVVLTSGEFYERNVVIRKKEDGCFLVETMAGSHYRAWRNRLKYNVASDAELVAGYAPGDPLRREAA